MAKDEKTKLLTPGGVEYVTSKPDLRPQQLGVIIVGAPGTGKSSSVAALGPVSKEMGIEGFNPFFIPGSRGLEGLEVNQPIKACPACDGSGCEICNGPLGPGKVRAVMTSYGGIKTWVEWAVDAGFNPIVFDTLPDFFDLCMDEVADLHGVEDVAEIPWSQGWKKARRKMREVCSYITRRNRGLYMICHLDVKTLVINGATYHKYAMDLTNQGKQEANALADIILWFHIDGDKWVAHVKPTEEVETKDRFGHMGVLPEIIDRGNSPEDFARTFLGCFFPDKVKKTS